MKLLRSLLALALLGCLAFAQNGNNNGSPPIVVAQQLQLPLVTDLPPVNQANVALVGNPGPATYYYWLVANYTFGQSSVSRLFVIHNGPNVLSSSNYVSITPTYPVGALSVDLLKTTSPTPPSGTGTYAVSTGNTSGAILDQGGALSSYTVNPIAPANYTNCLSTQVEGAGEAHLILDQGPDCATFIADLSAIGSSSGTVTNLTVGNLTPIFTASVATPTTTPVVTFTVSPATAFSVLGNPTGSAAGSIYTNSPELVALTIDGCASGTYVKADGTGCGTPGGSTVNVNGSPVASANFNGSVPAAGASGINITWQVSSSSVSAELVGNGNVADCLSGIATWVACGGSSGVTGSGTGGYLSEWTGVGSSTALANSPLDDQGAPTLIEPTHTYGLFMAGGQFGPPALTTAEGVLSNNTALTAFQVFENAFCYGTGARCSTLLSQAHDELPTNSSSNELAAGLFITNVLGGAATQVGQLSGLDVIAIPGGSLTAVGALVGVNSYAGCGAPIGAASGCAPSGVPSGSGVSLTNEYAGYFLANATAQTQSLNVGVYAGTAATAYSGGPSVAVVTQDADFYGASPAPTAGSTLTTHYGLYLADQTTASGGTIGTAYGIYEVAGLVYLGGNVTIGSPSTLTLSAMTGTSCLEEISGVVTATGSACGSGGGGFPSGVQGNQVALLSSGTGIAIPNTYESHTFTSPTLQTLLNACAASPTSCLVILDPGDVITVPTTTLIGSTTQAVTVIDNGAIIEETDTGGTTGTTTSLTESTNTVTVLSSLNPPVNGYVQITGSTVTGYNGYWGVQTSSGTQFTFTDPTGSLASCTSTCASGTTLQEIRDSIEIGQLGALIGNHRGNGSSGATITTASNANITSMVTNYPHTGIGGNQMILRGFQFINNSTAFVNNADLWLVSLEGNGGHISDISMNGAPGTQGNCTANAPGTFCDLSLEDGLVTGSWGDVLVDNSYMDCSGFAGCVSINITSGLGSGSGGNATFNTDSVGDGTQGSGCISGLGCMINIDGTVGGLKPAGEVTAIKFTTLYEESTTGATGNFNEVKNARDVDFGTVQFNGGPALTNGLVISGVSSGTGRVHIDARNNGGRISTDAVVNNVTGKAVVASGNADLDYTYPGETGLVTIDGAENINGVLTLSATNALVLSAMTGTSCLEEVSGVVTATGSACGSGGGSTALSALTNASASNTLANGNNPQVWGFAQTTNTQTAFLWNDTSAATGTGDVLVGIQTAANSTETGLSIACGAASTVFPAACLNLSSSDSGATNVPLLSLETTWNNTSLVGPAFSVAVTNTSSSTSSLVANFLAGTSGTSSVMSISTAGNLVVSEKVETITFEGVGTGTNTSFCGGQCTVTTNAVTAGELLQGSDNSNTGASAGGGYSILRGGMLTATTPSATAIEGATEIVSGALKGSAIANVGDVLGSTTTAYTLTDCATAGCPVVGIGTATANPVSYVGNGQALVKLDGALTAIGDYVGSGTTTAGEAHDYGTSGCPNTVTCIGVIIADSGTVPVASGNTTASVAMSTTLPLVQLTIAPPSTLASPGAIGGTTPAAGSFSSVADTGLTQYEVVYPSTSGGQLASITASTTPNGVPQVITEIPSGGALTAPVAVLPGVSGRAVTGTTSTDTIVSTDCNPNRIEYVGSVAVATTLPTATTLAVPYCVFKLVNSTTGASTAVTITPTTWTVNGASTLVLNQGQQASFYVDPSSATNWVADVSSQSPSENVVSFSATPTFSPTASANILTLTASLTSWTLGAGTPGRKMTLTFCQNATGSFTTGTTPSNVHGFFTIGATASKCSSQDFTYSANQTAWIATSTGVTNE
jgi:hypothetical protein